MFRIKLAMIAGLLAAVPASADSLLIDRGPFFTQTLSNTYPIAFGMTADETARALGSPLQHLRGRPGEETFLSIRKGASGFFSRDDRLFLQFRRGRLTGFKGDWGRNWMWH